ncbi:hypothetical protein EST38_g10939 [Candolleomyces aberdarensis]|uniref:Uncharacterized protein n=1 Tax=Candolleomyces aberdarensis TaxID=2316362 RepID=A0A4Q2D9F1_9AGAR|nr:hypothetical protein EST38_g10939 [Candolleomyces aberdarensis]
MNASHPRPARVAANRSQVISAARVGDPSGFSRLNRYVLQHQDSDTVILDAVLPFLEDVRLPSKKTFLRVNGSNSPRGQNLTRSSVNILLDVERARWSIDVIHSLCSVCPPAGGSKDEIVEKLLIRFELLLHWVNLFSVAGYIDTAAWFLLELWKFDPKLTQRFRHSSAAMQSLLSLWTADDPLPDNHVSRTTNPNFSPLINLLFMLSSDEDSRDLLVAVMDGKSKNVALIARAFQTRMKAIVSQYEKKAISREMAVAYLLKLTQVIRDLLPCDSRQYWARFLSREGLLYPLFGSYSSVTSLLHQDASWWLVADGVRYISHFVLGAKEYSGSPVVKMRDAISGGVIKLLLGCLLHTPASTEEHRSTIHLLKGIAPYFMHQEVWKAASHYFLCGHVEFLPPSTAQVLSANSKDGCTAWVAFQDTFHQADECHKRGSGESLRAHGCDNMNCQREDWEDRHREECSKLLPLYYCKDLHHWLPFSVKADVLAFAEDLYNRNFASATMNANNTKYIMSDSVVCINFNDIPYVCAIVESQKYTPPKEDLDIE